MKKKRLEIHQRSILNAWFRVPGYKSILYYPGSQPPFQNQLVGCLATKAAPVFVKREFLLFVANRRANKTLPPQVGSCPFVFFWFGGFCKKMNFPNMLGITFFQEFLKIPDILGGSKVIG